MVEPTSSFPMGYLLDREELLRVRDMKLLTNVRDYVFFALQIDYPGTAAPQVDVEIFCERWNLVEGDLYKALGELRNKGIVVSIASRLDLRFQT